MKFCSACGALVAREIPPGDDRPRAVCKACGTVHYENPRTVVGCVVEHGDEILLCRRAIEPARGLWTVPAGFLEIGEAATEGAARETLEEAQARVEVLAPHAYLDLPLIGQSYALFRARLLDGAYGVGDESLEVATFSLDTIPWDEMAFPVIRIALELYAQDRERGAWRFHLGVVEWSEKGAGFDWRRCTLRDHLATPLA